MIYLSGCKVAEQYIFQTDLRRKSYPVNLDSDSDGLTDIEELDAGYDPDNADTNGNGIPDGDDDDDGDGMSNAWEIKLGFDSKSKDSASSSFGSYFANNGIGECDEDIDSDGLANCWEIKNSLDPTNPNDANTDLDGDGYTALQEYTDYDPNDPESHPPSEKDLILYDNNLVIVGRTNSVGVRGTARYCFGGDSLLLSGSATAPSENDPAWVSCTIASLALNGTLANATEGAQTMYLWRKNSIGVNKKPVAASVNLDVTGPTGDLVVADRGFNWIDLTLTPPTNSDYTSVALRRYAGVSCADDLATGGTPLPVVKSTTSYRDAGLTQDTQYCYKAFWYDDLENTGSKVAVITQVPSKTLVVSGCTKDAPHNVWYVGASLFYTVSCNNKIESVGNTANNWPSFLALTSTLPHDSAYTISGTTNSALSLTNWTALINEVHTENFSTTVLSGSGITYDADQSLTITSNVSTDLQITALLDSVYDGSAANVSIKGLMGNTVTPATTSNGSVVATETNIPLLSYTDSGSCAIGVSPYVCTGSSTYVPNTKLVTGTMSLLWNYNYFDHGEYFIRTKSYNRIDNAPFYGTQETTIVTTTNSTNANTEWFHRASNSAANGNCGDCLVDNTLTNGPALWFTHKPAVAIHHLASNSSDQNIGVVFTGVDTSFKQFGGVLRIDREVGNTADVDILRGFEVFGPNKLQLTANGVGSKAMAMASTSLASADEWYALNVQQVAGGDFDLLINRIGGNGSVVTTLNATNFAARDAAHDDSAIHNVALTRAYLDGANYYHGLAFSITPDLGTTSLYVSRFRSEPTSFTMGNLFDATGMYGTGHFMDGIVASVKVYDSLTPADLSMVQLIVDDGVTDYFYVGWRDEATEELMIRRVASANGAVVSATPIADFATSAQGTPGYAMALGKDGATDILGVLYTNDTDLQCFFQPLNKNTLVAIGARITVSAPTCLYPHLFYDTTLNRFVATYVNTSRNTVVHTFGFSSGLVNAETVTMTNRTGSAFNNALCNFTADFSDVLNRLVTFSIEGLCTASDAMIVDMYKVREK